MINIVVLISGNGSNLQAIINECHGRTVNIAAVISDQSNAYGLKRAGCARIPGIVAYQQPDETREHYCEQLADIVDQYNPQLIILAGFMKILTPDFVKRYPNRIINIHPSLLPKYPGLHTHERVLEHNDRRHGITIHLVNEELDAGPILLQKSFPVLGDDIVSLEQKCHQLEHTWYPEVISLLARWETAIRRS